MADSSLAAPLAFPLGGSTVYITSLCDVWAQDLIAITFQEALVNDIFLQSTQAYTVTPLDGGTPVNVVSVQTGKEANATTVWIAVTAPDVGKTYQITFQNLYATTGLVVTPKPCNLVGRMTKQDSIITGRPQMYDMRPDSTIRKLLQAIGREDDRIGGARSDYFTSPI
jgi:hypothetical protein